jgi:DNA polymerase-3 subunit alpha
MYSYLDAISTPRELIMRAKELNMDSISVNDHASINALPDMLKYGKEFGIKSIIGVEYYVVFRDDLNINTKNESRYHLNVMARNWNGVKKLFEKLTLANTQKYYRPRLYFDQILDFGDDVILSTACAISMLMRPDYEKIIQTLQNTYKDNLFLEIIPTSFDVKDDRPKKEKQNNPIESIDQAKIINLRVIELCKKYNIKHVCTMDTHFAYPEHRQAHEISLCVSTKDKIYKPRNERFYFDGAGIYDGDYIFNEFNA